MTIAGANYRDGVAFIDGALCVTPTGNAAITGGTITGITDLAVADGGTGASTAAAAANNLGMRYKLAQWGIPVGIISSGSMGNNGAVTGLTAMPMIYSQGGYFLFPANSIAAGVPATPTFYWFVGSSTTAGTVYNSTFDPTLGLPPTTGTQTAFATTGPGAFTGDTSERVVIRIAVPANAMGTNGSITGDWLLDFNTAAGNKTLKLQFGGSSLSTLSGSTQSGGIIGHTAIQNQGTAVQRGGALGNSGSQAFALGSRTTIDTTSATTVGYTLTNATATNHAILEFGSFFLAQ